jgi:hypothetical protein
MAKKPLKTKDTDIISAPIEDTSININTISTTRIKNNLAKLNDDAELITTSESDLYASPQQNNFHAMLFGLDVPSCTSGKMSPIDEQRWIVVIENLISRGLNTHQQIAKLTGLNPDLSKKYVMQIKENWAKNLSQGTVNVRRESLYLEHDRIKNYCWNQIDLSDPSESRNQLGFIKAIQTSLTAQSNLIGANIVSIDVSNNNIRAMTEQELQQAASKVLDIDANNLKQLADLLATSIVEPKEDDEEGEEDATE